MTGSVLAARQDQGAVPIVQQDGRGGVQTLDAFQLTVLEKTTDYVVINKAPDSRLDGAFDVTIEKALHRDFPAIEKFRWIHQLDFATSGVMCIGIEKAFTSSAAKGFEMKKVQKEYVALVEGHLMIPTSSSSYETCALENLNSMIENNREKLHAQKRKRYVRKNKSYPKGPRSASTFFDTEKALLKRRKWNGENIEKKQDEMITTSWKSVSKVVKGVYLAQQENDRIRFEKEIKEFELKMKEKEDAIPQEQPADDVKENEKHDQWAYILSYPIAECKGSFKMEIGSNENPGKDATTLVFVLQHGTLEGKPVSKVLLRPLNGRRHQLRLHLQKLGHPIVGDATYGNSMNDATRMMLHAWKLVLHLPKGPMHFTAPDAFSQLCVWEETEMNLLSTITDFCS